MLQDEQEKPLKKEVYFGLNFERSKKVLEKKQEEGNRLITGLEYDVWARGVAGSRS